MAIIAGMYKMIIAYMSSTCCKSSGAALFLHNPPQCAWPQ